MGADRDNKGTIADINWNDIIKHDTRSSDNIDLGKVKGLLEPFIVIERGTISKEKFYIPKSLIEKYDTDVLYFGITEQEAKDIYMRESPPTEDEVKHIETITEKRGVGSRKDIEIAEQAGNGEGEEGQQRSKTEEKKIMVAKKSKELKEKLSTTITSTTSISTPEIDEEEIIKKVKQAASELKDIILSGAKVAKEKIKEGKDIAEEKIK